MNRRGRATEVDRLRAIPLEAVLPLCGAAPDRQDRRKWHTPAGPLSIHGPKFMNWSRGVGGGGAIDLVIHLQGLGFRAALDWLGRHFAAALPPAPPAAAPALQLPAPVPAHLPQVKTYLAVQRGLAPALLDATIHAGLLYADTRANAVFVLRGQDQTPVGAELRGTWGPVWRGMAPGSRKDLGCFAVGDPAAATVLLCESAIDALSAFQLDPRRRTLSTAGARPDPAWLAPLVASARPIYCGFDADATGESMARAMIARHPSIRRLRPALKDWNELLRAHA